MTFVAIWFSIIAIGLIAEFVLLNFAAPLIDAWAMQEKKHD